MAYRVTQLRALLIITVALLPMLGDAHEMRPGYLDIRETAADTYEVLWKVPAQGDDLRMTSVLSPSPSPHLWAIPTRNDCGLSVTVDSRDRR
jgi:hypothetical protein